MRQIKSLSEGLDLFKTLGSDIRLKILFLLAREGQMNLNDIAGALAVTNGAVTSHIRKLEEAGLIEIKPMPTGRGMQKVCRLTDTSLLLDIEPARTSAKYAMYETDLEVGHYSDYLIHPACGIAGGEGMIGTENDIRAFAFPERISASMLWFHQGYIEYRIPNLLPDHQQLVQLTLSFEISSAEQGDPNGRPEEVFFSLNDHPVGSWFSADTHDQKRGIYMPSWWNSLDRRHGYLKMIVINGQGAFLDGIKIMDLDEHFSFLDEQGGMRFRLTAGHVGGGIALYGSNSGNYRQAIKARVHYAPMV